ncbi:MAG: carboxypeptidase regulatory-like domain-containing protein [Longimicrobiales bacterium]
MLQNRGAVITLACALALIGCGDAADDADTGGEVADAEPLVDPAQAATISGVVNFEGEPPAPEPIDMSEEPTCAEKHEGQPVRTPVVASDGRLKNVFVRVSEGLPDRSWPSATEPREIDQDGCVYEPHVLGIQTGQTLTIRNSDGILHNINATPENNQSFNISQPTTMESTRSFSRPEVMIPVRCDVHGWMEAYIGVVEHPYYAVTGDDGSFTIENLPPGDYVIEAWHERYGTQTANVSVQAQGTGEANFTYNANMAATAVVPLGEPIDLHDHGVAGGGATHTSSSDGGR